MVYKLHPVAWANDVTNWRLQLGISSINFNFNFNSMSRSWNTKGGCTLLSMHTMIEERRALIWLTHYCVHVFLILCVSGVHDPLFPQLLDMGMDLNFFQGCPLLKDENCWIMSKLQTRNLFLVVCAEIKCDVKN